MDTKKNLKKDQKQPNLYGDEDKVFNVLETDVTMIKADITARHGKIDKLKDDIEKLTVRLEEVEEARDIVAKTRKTAEPKKEKTPAEMRA